MKKQYLFPSKYKSWGWVLLLLGIPLGLITLFTPYEPEVLDFKVLAILYGDFEKHQFFSLINQNILNELAGLLLIVGGLLVAFSKEKVEDEFIANVRLRSLVWATIISYVLLIIAMLFFYDFSFFMVMNFNMFSILLLFIIKFNWSLYQMRKELQYEESN